MCLVSPPHCLLAHGRRPVSLRLRELVWETGRGEQSGDGASSGCRHEDSRKTGRWQTVAGGRCASVQGDGAVSDRPRQSGKNREVSGLRSEEWEGFVGREIGCAGSWGRAGPGPGKALQCTPLGLESCRGSPAGQGLEDQQSQAVRGAAWTARGREGLGQVGSPGLAAPAGLSCDLDFGLLIPGSLLLPRHGSVFPGGPRAGQAGGGEPELRGAVGLLQAGVGGTNRPTAEGWEEEVRGCQPCGSS